LMIPSRIQVPLMLQRVETWWKGPCSETED
jgi:hypothetical protein